MFDESTLVSILPLFYRYIAFIVVGMIIGFVLKVGKAIIGMLIIVATVFYLFTLI